MPALEGVGAPDPETMAADIAIEDLPHDEQGHLLRPGVVWCLMLLYVMVLLRFV